MSGMTKLVGVPDSDDVIPGMAYFQGSGPDGKTCGNCAHRGYGRQSANGRWREDLQQFVHNTYRTQACAMFKALAGHHGPAIDAGCKACKYFEQKPAS